MPVLSWSMKATGVLLHKKVIMLVPGVGYLFECEILPLESYVL